MINMAHNEGSMVNTQKKVLDHFNNPRAWKWCAGILGLTVFKSWKSVVMRKRVRVCPAFIHLVRWETGISGAHGGCNGDRWGRLQACAGNSQRQRWDCLKRSQGRFHKRKEETQTWKKEEERKHFHKDHEGKEYLLGIFGMVLCQDLRRPSRRNSDKRIWTLTWVLPGSVEDTSVWKNR